jgi:hypothetical protein
MLRLSRSWSSKKARIFAPLHASARGGTTDGPLSSHAGESSPPAETRSAAEIPARAGPPRRWVGQWRIEQLVELQARAYELVERLASLVADREGAHLQTHYRPADRDAAGPLCDLC